MRRHETKKQGVFERIRSAMIKNEFPLEPVAGYRIELCGKKARSRALVSGAKRILVCNDTQIVLETGEGCLCFEGSGLDCICYEGGIAEILGCIKGFSLLGKEGA